MLHPPEGLAGYYPLTPLTKDFLSFGKVTRSLLQNKDKLSIWSEVIDKKGNTNVHR